MIVDHYRRDPLNFTTHLLSHARINNSSHYRIIPIIRWSVPPRREKERIQLVQSSFVFPGAMSLLNVE